MRGRFLNADYFSTPPSHVYETLGFLNLPVPDNFPAPVVSDGEDIFLRFGSPEDFSLPISNLPIESALSKFIADVVPDRISVDGGVFEMDYSFSDELKLLRYEDSEFLEKKDGDVIEEKFTLNFNVIHFETPELDSEMEERVMEDLQCFSEVLQIENEPVKFEESDIIRQNSKDIQQKICSVDYISSDYFTENTTSVTEDECFRKKRTWFRNARFPLLEVDEVNLSVLPSLSMLDIAVTVLETVKPQETNAESFLSVSSKELLVSTDYDLLDILSTDCYSNKREQSDLVPEGSEIDIVTILEASKSEDFEHEQRKLAAGFEEFQILDVEITDVFDIFLCLQKVIEPEICCGMFSEEMNFKNFDELVVSSELAFTDDAFKSLPTPLLYDHEMTRSLDLIYENVLSEIKPQSFPVSNDIYLPWNLLQERKHNHEAPFCEEEIVECNIDYEFGSLEGDKWVYDFIFSEDSFCEPLEEGCTEPFYGISTLRDHPPVNASHGLLETLSPKRRAVDDNAKKAMLLFKSVSAFDDLNFFMDPQKAATEENPESRVTAARTADFESRVEAAKTTNLESRVEVVKITNLESRVEAAKAAKSNDYKSCSSSETTKESEFVAIPQDPGRKSGIIEQGVLSEQRAVIVVNTKTVDKEMIISRRSTYQKVLAMEREGVQVVERDSDLPVDLMLSPAICLLWYDCTNASKKPAAAIGASSSSLSWIGDIATNVLTSLSFSFSSCIMVFEGESNCLAAVMESSDELYAAAGSLGISLQIFCSTSADLTDEIILRCIRSSVVLSQVHDKMPESESLAESFLTKFPSVNPLTAQVILSSAGTLLEFMKLPLSSKVQRMEKYHVPDESIDLFSSLCKYGAREDSKSVMTDSSSSVSSGPDSDTHHFSAHSDSKRKQHTSWENEIDIDELVHFTPSTEFVDAKLKPSGDLQLDDSWSSKDHEMFHFDPVTDFSDATLKPSGIIDTNDSWPSKDPERFDKKSRPGSSSKDAFWEKDFAVEDNLLGFEDWNFPVTDELRSQSRRGHNFSAMGSLNLQDTRSSESFTPDYKGEVINISGSKFLEEDFPPSPSYKRHAPVASDGDEDIRPRKSKFARKLSFSEPLLHPNFPTASEINSSPERLAADGNASLRGYVDNFPTKRQRTLLEEVLTRRSAASTMELPFREEISHFGGSPLSNAIRSANPVQGSPWTMEFLNRVRERSRERQQNQSLPSYLTPSSLKTQGNLKKASTKTKSPSILEFFKYKGSNTRSKLPEEKTQKRSKYSSASPKDYSPLKSWTPIDKRSKQTLSFAINGTGRQTKLVWK